MIEINNLTQTKIDENFVKKVVRVVLRGEKGREAISLAIVGPQRIKELNKKYRRKNEVTDVLSFTDKDLKEIVISPQGVKKNVKRYSSSFKKELARSLIHGLLHLLGYRHEKSKKAALKMSQKERDYLAKL